MAKTGVASDPSRNGHSPNGHVTTPGQDPASAESSGSLLSRAMRGMAEQLQSRIPRADLDERDPDYIRERLPLMWLLASIWF
ncbi:MAG: hypothetical protein ACXVQR_03955, partial [Solirubrobacteraceae bacterium]